MHRRIYGTELEYGVFSWELVPKHMALKEFLHRVSEVTDTLPPTTNGSRIYTDTGSHPEYCTPECLTPFEVVLHEKAGELILQDAFRKPIKANGVEGEVRFYRTIADNHGNTHGYHENYSLDRNVPQDYMIEQLVPFLVTRVIYTGSGNVNRMFRVSGRGQHIVRTEGPSTTNNRAIVNLRDEPLANEERFRRLHLIVGDPNMSEISTYLKIGATGLLLDLIEDGIMAYGIEIIDPVEALHRLSANGLSESVALNGKTMSAIDLQRIYLELAYEHFDLGCNRDSPGLRAMNKDILITWERVLDALERDPYLLADELDWVIEKKMLEAQMRRQGLSWNDSRVQQLDLRYHETDRERSIFYNLQQRGLVKRLVTDEDIEKARYTPPNTRAKGRVLFAKKSRERGINLYASDDMWSALGHNGLVVQMPNPFKTYEQVVQDFFRKI